jgi:inorganic pyrophosphatase
MWSQIRDLPDLNENLLNEIQHFFQVYKDLEQKTVETGGFGDRVEAAGVIAEARRAGAGHDPGSRS